jgi:dUTP pyrophosphatase
MSRYFKVVSNEHRQTEGYIKLPTRATAKSAAYDFYSPVDATIEPMKSVMIWTDVKAHMYDDNVLLLNVRSSMGKHPIMIANTQGWVDADYWENTDNDGNIGIRLFNLGNTPYEIKVGDRIAQGMFVKYGIVCDDKTKEKRTGGFGSTNN